MAAAKVPVITDWRDIDGFPGYAINSYGQVRGRRFMLTPSIRNGYRRAQMHQLDGRYVKRPLHLLVLTAFVGPKPTPLHEGAHIDGDRNNNHVSNLVWKTRRENEADKRAHGTATSGSVKVRITPRQLAHARKMLAAGASLTAIAKRYGIHRRTAARLLRP